MCFSIDDIQQNQHEFTERVCSVCCLLDGEGDPDSLLILAEEELVAVDLQTAGWPLYRLPYVNSIHASSIVSASHINNVPHSLWERIKTAGYFQLTDLSPRVCCNGCCGSLLSQYCHSAVSKSSCAGRLIIRILF